MFSGHKDGVHWLHSESTVEVFKCEADEVRLQKQTPHAQVPGMYVMSLSYLANDPNCQFSDPNIHLDSKLLWSCWLNLNKVFFHHGYMDTLIQNTDWYSEYVKSSQNVNKNVL